MSSTHVLIRKRVQRLAKRRKHIRKVVFGTTEVPRLVVFRSNRHIYAQIVDDSKSHTITGCSTLSPNLKDNLSECKKMIDKAKVIGGQIAKLAVDLGFKKVCFDRNGRIYHGRVKAVAEGARAGGLKF